MPSNKGKKGSGNTESKQSSSTTSKSGMNSETTNPDNVSTNSVVDDNQQIHTNDNSTIANKSTSVTNDTTTSIGQVDVVGELKTLTIQLNNQIKENAEITRSFQLQMSQITSILVGLSNQVTNITNSNLSPGPTLNIVKPIVTNPSGMTIDPNVSTTINQGSTTTSNLVIDSATITNMVPEVKAPNYIVENSNSDMSPNKFSTQNNVNQSINPAITATNKSVPVTAVYMTSARNSSGNVQSSNTNQSSASKYGDNNHNDKTKSFKSNGNNRGNNVFSNSYTARTLIQHAGLGSQLNSTRNESGKLGLQHVPVDRGKCVNIYINWNDIQEGVRLTA